MFSALRSYSFSPLKPLLQVVQEHSKEHTQPGSPDMLVFREHWPFFLFRFPSGDLALDGGKVGRITELSLGSPFLIQQAYIGPQAQLPASSVLILPPTPRSADKIVKGPAIQKLQGERLGTWLEHKHILGPQNTHTHPHYKTLNTQNPQNIHLFKPSVHDTCRKNLQDTFKAI